jgi:hypothetical protein
MVPVSISVAVPATLKACISVSLVVSIVSIHAIPANVVASTFHVVLSAYVAATIVWITLPVSVSFSLVVPVSLPTHFLVSCTFAWMIVVVPAFASRMVEISRLDVVNFSMVITTKCAVHRLVGWLECSVTMTQL